MSRKYLLDCTASGAKWADDVHSWDITQGEFYERLSIIP